MMNRLSLAATCAAILLASLACNRPTAPQYDSLAAKQSGLAWNTHTLVDAYKQAGHTDAKWDDAAKTALTEFARTRARVVEPDEDANSMISVNCGAAVDAGCDDPMVRYLFARFHPDPTESKQTVAESYCRTAAALESSSYPKIRKYYAWLRAAQQVIYAYGYGTNVPQNIAAFGAWSYAETDLVDALGDKSMPPEEAYEAASQLLHEWKGNKDPYRELYQKIDAQLPATTAKAPVMLLLKGEANIEMAWHARGSGYSDSVTGEAQKLFAQHLAAAEEALNKAWQLDPTDARIPLKMMSVELGQGQGRDRMELWFDRAMQLNHNNYDACYAKLYYLEPKWYGSAQDMLSFGQECATNAQWGGYVPLILLDAHQSIQRQYLPPEQKTNYWSRPEVWADLKIAFDRFFELNPAETGRYHDYAWYAYQAGDWAAFNEAVPKMGKVNYTFFGGKDSFDAMVALAKQQAGGTQTKN